MISGYGENHPLVKFKSSNDMEKEDLLLHDLKNEIISKVDDYNHRLASLRNKRIKLYGTWSDAEKYRGLVIYNEPLDNTLTRLVP